MFSGEAHVLNVTPRRLMDINKLTQNNKHHRKSQHLPCSTEKRVPASLKTKEALTQLVTSDQ